METVQRTRCTQKPRPHVDGLPISILSDRHGSQQKLVVVCLAGMFAFLLVSFGTSYPVMVVSQVVYAMFAAGF
ncbi:hypothetical protein [Amycolatopsis plumensis]|uniref:MFS transporter n=1 Tax=Amycolatopsis plumensis TaxID=236508 RepID=A0ABV5UHY7_9PSEU